MKQTSSGFALWVPGGVQGALTTLTLYTVLNTLTTLTYAVNALNELIQLTPFYGRRAQPRTVAKTPEKATRTPGKNAFAYLVDFKKYPETRPNPSTDIAVPIGLRYAADREAP